jgi:hypothetical protein
LKVYIYYCIVFFNFKGSANAHLDENRKGKRICRKNSAGWFGAARREVRHVIIIDDDYSCFSL